MSNLVNQYAEEEYAKDTKNIKGKSKKKAKKIPYTNEGCKVAFKVSEFENWKKRLNKR